MCIVYYILTSVGSGSMYCVVVSLGLGYVYCALTSVGLGPVYWSEKWIVSMMSGYFLKTETSLESNMAEATSATLKFNY